MDVRRRRIVLAVMIPVIVVLGLLLHDMRTYRAYFVADALYTVLVYVLVALVWPRLRPWWPATIAFGFSAAVELFQLTGIPAELAGRVPMVALVLGERFGWLDIVAYAAGATIAAVVDVVVNATAGRSAARRGGPEPSEPRRALVLDPGERLGE